MLCLCYSLPFCSETVDLMWFALRDLFPWLEPLVWISASPVRTDTLNYIFCLRNPFFVCNDLRERCQVDRRIFYVITSLIFCTLQQRNKVYALQHAHFIHKTYIFVSFFQSSIFRDGRSLHVLTGLSNYSTNVRPFYPFTLGNTNHPYWLPNRFHHVSLFCPTSDHWVVHFFVIIQKWNNFKTKVLIVMCFETFLCIVTRSSSVDLKLLQLLLSWKLKGLKLRNSHIWYLWFS